MDVNDFPIYFFGGLYNYLSLDHDNQYTSWLIVLRLFEGMDRQHATDREGCATNSTRKVSPASMDWFNWLKERFTGYNLIQWLKKVTCRGCVMRRDRHKMKVQKRGEKCRLYYMAGLNLQAEHNFFLPANKWLSWKTSNPPILQMISSHQGSYVIWPNTCTMVISNDRHRSPLLSGFH